MRATSSVIAASGEEHLGMARDPTLLRDRVAVVTGAARGIGRASARALAVAGARVVVADLDRDGAESVAKEIRDADGEAFAVCVDVSEEETIAAMIEDTLERFGGLDILHNNAAASDMATGSRDGALVDLEVEVWDRAMAVNLRGPMLGCKHAIPVMLRRGRGSIIQTSSASGLCGDLARAAYSASKAGLDSLTRSVATQYGKQGIRCNSIAPGVVETPALAANVPPEALAAYLGSSLTPRLGKPEDIAAAVVFLASDDAAYITGQVLSVDGGLLAHHPTVAALRPEPIEARTSTEGAWNDSN
jgi:NAD(P)-dependent dehydrogenase (short-subunit alcohol dehydrogenase family)